MCNMLKRHEQDARARGDGIRIGVADVAGFLGNVCEPNHNNPNECVITIPSIDRAIDIAGDVSDSIGRS